MVQSVLGFAFCKTLLIMREYLTTESEQRIDIQEACMHTFGALVAMARLLLARVFTLKNSATPDREN